MEIANNKIMKERSSATLPIRRLGTTFRIAFNGGSVSVKTVSETSKSGPLGRQSRAKMETYSKTNLAIKIKT
jgi:hypothetical protein